MKLSISQRNKAQKARKEAFQIAGVVVVFVCLAAVVLSFTLSFHNVI